MKFVVEHVEKSYGKKDVLKDAGFVFEEGKIYGLLGRNGAGKTTLFNCINDDIKVNGGEFYFLEDDSGSARREVTPSDIGYVLSTPNVPEFLTAREFLRFFLEINPRFDGAASEEYNSAASEEHNGVTESLREEASHQETPMGEGKEIHRATDEYNSLISVRTDRYFDIVKIAKEDRDRLLKDYSHGMKNKMQMLIALLSRPKLLLLDEPLTSLDVVVSEEMKSLLRKYKEGRITIFSTHILDLAIDLCDEIVLLSRGKLEKVDHQQLSNDEFKKEIIRALQAEDDVDYGEVPVEPQGSKITEPMDSEVKDA